MKSTRYLWIIVSGLVFVGPTVWACPLCLLGMYEAHIAHFGNWLMNTLPFIAPMLTGVALYWKNIVRRICG